MNIKTLHLPTFRIPKNKYYDYCPRCRRRTPHIKNTRVRLCKRCGIEEKY